MVRDKVLAQTMMASGQRLPKRPDHPRGTGFRPIGAYSHINAAREEYDHPVYGRCTRPKLMPIDQALADLRQGTDRLAEYYSRQQGKGKKVRNLMGNLQNSDYRFWVGHDQIVSKFAQCRACRVQAYSHQMRRLHRDADKCTTLLVRAYKILLKDELCVMCDEKTLNTKWGIPICAGGACLERFMFNPRLVSLSLHSAIESVRREDERLAREWANVIKIPAKASPEFD